MNKIAFFLSAGLTSLSLSVPALAATKIQWWHAMGGENGAKLEQIAKGFNASQSDYEIVPVYKGTYDETLTGAIAAFRANQQPAIVQVYEVGTGTMMAAQGAVYPVYQLMKDEGRPGTRANSLPRSSATTRTPAATSCPCRSIPRRRSCITTRMSSKKRGSIRKHRRKHGRTSRPSRGRS